MKAFSLIGERKSQVLVSVLITLAVILVLGSALVFHSRTALDVSKGQDEYEKAYAIAKSGLGMADRLLVQDPAFTAGTYNMNGGQAVINVSLTEITSTGIYASARRELKKNRPAAPASLWVKAYAKVSTNERMSDIIETTDNEYLIDGWQELGTNSHVMKIQGNGNKTWAKSITQFTQSAISVYGPSAPKNVDSGSKTLLESSAYFSLKKTTDANADFALLKLGTNGSFVWAKRYGTASGDNPTYIEQNTNGGAGDRVIMGGQYNATAGEAILLNASDFSVSAAYTFDGNGIDSFVAAIPFMESGNQRYLLVGNTNSSNQGAWGSGDIFVIKTDANLVPVAPATSNERIFGSATVEETALAARVSYSPGTSTVDGFVIVGYRQNEGLVFKINNTSLVRVWARQIGGNYADKIQDVIQDPASGDYFLVGNCPIAGAADFDGFFCRIAYNTGDFVSSTSKRTYNLTSKPGNDQFWGACRTTSAPLGLILAGDTSSLGDTATKDRLLVRSDTAGDSGTCSFGKDPGTPPVWNVSLSATNLNQKNVTTAFTATSRTPLPAGSNGDAYAVTVSDDAPTIVTNCGS